MFLHIGENIYLLKKDIVAILNTKTLNSKGENRFIVNLMEFNELKNIEMDNVESYILTCENRRNRKKRTSDKVCKLYTSNISSTTLLKRFEHVETRLEV